MILSKNSLSVDIILPKAEEVRQLFRMPLHLLLRSASFTLDSRRLSSLFSPRPRLSFLFSHLNGGNNIVFPSTWSAL